MGRLQDPWAWVPEEWKQPAAPVVPPAYDVSFGEAQIEPEPPPPAPVAPPPKPRQYDVQLGEAQIEPEADAAALKNKILTGAASTDEILANERAKYERFAATHPEVTPKMVDSWVDRKRGEIERFAKQKPQIAHIAQATGPVGTIGTIGKDMPSGGPSLANPGQAPEGGWGQIPGLLTPPMLGAPESVIEMPEEYVGKPLEADAVSGVGAIPKSGDYVGPGQTSGKPELPDEYMTGEEYGQKLSTLPIEKQEMERAKIEGARQAFATARALEDGEKAVRAAQDNARILEQSIKDSQQRTAELDLEARNLADENPLESISGGTAVFGVLASIVGGFLSASTGRNRGLEMIDQIADRAAQQHAQRVQMNARQRAAVGDDIEHAQAVYRAGETARLATLDGMAKSLEAEVQNFDSRGTTALRVMDTVNQIKAKRAELLAKYQTEEQKRAEAAAKQRLEIAKFQEDQRKNLAGEKLEGWKIGESARAAKAREGIDRDQLRLEAARLRQAGDDKAAERLSERGVGGLVVPTGEVDEKGAPKFAFKMLTNADGKPFEAPTKEEAILSRKKKAAVDTITSLMDETIKLINEHGWEPDFVKSPAWQTMKANWGTVKVKEKDFQDLGALTTADAPIIDAVTGSNDPTQLRNTVPGIEKAFDNTVRQYDDDLRSLGYTGEKYSPAKSWKLPGASTTAEDVAFKQSLKRPMPTVEEARQAEEERMLRPPSERYTTEGTASAAQVSQQQLIRSLVDKMSDATLPQAQRDAARARLERGVEQGQSPEIRDAYQRALSGAIGASIPVTKDTE